MTARKDNRPLAVPNVSIVIPMYNAERYLGETLQSVLRQTYQDFEIILVDDGSTDATGDIAKNLDDGRITYFRQANRGASAARNKGLEMARGTFVIFLDADDVWLPSMLNACVSYLEAEPDVSVVFTRSKFIDPEGNLLPGDPSGPLEYTDILASMIMGPFIHTSAALIRRSCLGAIGGWDENRSLQPNEDWELWLRIAAAGFQFGFIDMPLELYRRHETNITLHYKSARNSRIAVLDKFFATVPNVAVYESRKHKAYASALVRSCMEAFRGGLFEEGIRDYKTAILYDPDLAQEVSTYYQIACISVPVGSLPTIETVDPVAGWQCLRHIDRLLEEGHGIVLTKSARQAARARLRLAAGMVNYTYKEDMLAARRHFAGSIYHQPADPLTWVWFARAMVGRKNARRLKAVLYR